MGDGFGWMLFSSENIDWILSATGFPECSQVMLGETLTASQTAQIITKIANEPGLVLDDVSNNFCGRERDLTTLDAITLASAFIKVKHWDCLHGFTLTEDQLLAILVGVRLPFSKVEVLDLYEIRLTNIPALVLVKAFANVLQVQISRVSGSQLAAVDLLVWEEEPRKTKDITFFVPPGGIEELDEELQAEAARRARGGVGVDGFCEALLRGLAWISALFCPWVNI